jgi:hypothetical protein
MRILIRDDDVCYFTDPERFQAVHAFLIGNRIPFNVAVVPEVSDCARSSWDSVEGFIPARMACRGKSHPVGGNAGLVRMLKRLDFVEIAQHGFSHEGLEPGRPEFWTDDREDIVRRLEAGTRILGGTFGKRPAFFVPPRDQITKTALSEIRKRFSGISLSRFPHGMLPFRLWPKFLWNKRNRISCFNWSGFRMVQHPGVDFSDPGTADRPRERNLFGIHGFRDVLVLPFHSWRFFDNEGRVKKKLLASWENRLKEMVEREDLEFIPFSRLK